MIEQLISRVFYARNLAHFEHWRTKSYSQHKALGSFYDDVIDAVDTDSTGIIVNQEATCNINVNGATYIYLAVA